MKELEEENEKLRLEIESLEDEVIQLKKKLKEHQMASQIKTQTINPLRSGYETLSAMEAYQQFEMLKKRQRIR